MSDQKFIMVKKARVSFPDIFERSVVDGVEGSYGATLLLDPEGHASIIKELEVEIDHIVKAKHKGNKIPSGMRCLKDGDDMSRVEYEGHMVLSTNAKNKPHVFKPNSNEKAEKMSESKIYSGCYIDAKIQLWAQKNNYGKRVNAQLVAVRFAGDGEAFSAGHVSADQAAEGFEVSDDQDAFFDEAA